MIVRDTTPADFDAVRAVLVEAFDQPDEAELVAALRRSGDAAVDMVAEVDGAVVGHILMSALQAPKRCLALAPVCVVPSSQNQGIGTALIRAALDRASAGGWQAAFVLGEPNYYTRFGFEVGKAAKFETAYPSAYFMALELAPSALETLGGRVVYAAPFTDLA